MKKTIQTLIATITAAVVALASFTQLCLALASTNPVAQPRGEETQQADAQDTAEGGGQTEEATATEESISRDQFVATWAERIDAFNEGYPLAGYGNVFAEAAYDNHVDPRLSPAIAPAESGTTVNKLSTIRIDNKILTGFLIFCIIKICLLI